MTATLLQCVTLACDLGIVRSQLVPGRQFVNVKHAAQRLNNGSVNRWSANDKNMCARSSIGYKAIQVGSENQSSREINSSNGCARKDARLHAVSVVMR